MPKRIQRKRTRGWKMPPDAIYVGRPTAWGNPFRVGTHGTQNECVALFRKWFSKEIAPEGSELYEFRETCESRYGVSGWDGFTLACACHHWLRGHDLACWCKEGEACHADVLLRIANE